MRLNRPYTRLLLAAMAGMASGVGAWAAELPAALLQGLKSETFAERELAESELLAWTRQHVEAALEDLYQQSRTAGEPEVRERCLAVLRELVADDYLRNRVGFLGIRMNLNTEIVNLPDAAKPLFAIRVLQVEPGTPAHKSGMVAGDLLLGVDDTLWQQEHTSGFVMEKIKSFKAGTRVSIKLCRDGKVIDVPVVLAPRPAVADQLQFQFGMGMQAGPEAAAAAERTAKEDNFRRWLAARKSRE
ncbi:MAG: PDZ domain-containing protein [Verrucomicrobiota bacterium]